MIDFTVLPNIGANINQIGRGVNAGIARPVDAKHGQYMLDRVYELMDRLEKNKGCKLTCLLHFLQLQGIIN